MKIKLLAASILLVTTSTVQATEFNVKSFLNKTYITVGVGYKFEETVYWYPDVDGISYKFDDPYSARLKVEYRYNEYVSFGIDHHSQWGTGFPINTNKNEPYKTELFIDLHYSLGDLF